MLPFVQLNEASNPEKEFVKYLEEHSQWIDWWYKNGDKGKQHYAIAYGKSLFYVDFVIRMKNGHVYLFDTKSAGSDVTAPENIMPCCNISRNIQLKIHLFMEELSFKMEVTGYIPNYRLRIQLIC